MKNRVMQPIASGSAALPKQVAILCVRPKDFDHLDDVAFQSCCRSGSSNFHSYSTLVTLQPIFFFARASQVHRDLVILRLLTLARILMQGTDAILTPSTAPLISLVD